MSPNNKNLNIYAPREFAAKIEKLAKSEGRSVSQQVLWMLRQFMAEKRTA